MNTSLPALAFAMSLTLVACSGTTPIDKLTESSPGRASASPSASAAYDPKPASPTPGGLNEDGDYVGDTNSWAMFDDPKTAFPVTIDHAYGSTTIPSQPKRVVTLDMASTGASTALVRIPYAFPKASNPSNEQGYYPWLTGIIDGFGVEKTDPNALQTLNMSNGIPFEAVEATKPDVIFMLQDDLSEADYKRLSEIAPVVIRPGKPGETTPRELVMTVGKALGQYNHAKALLGDEDVFYGGDGDDLSMYKGKTLLIADIPTEAAQPLKVYPATNVRMASMRFLGFEPASMTQENSPIQGQQHFLLTSDQASKAASDLVIAFADNPKLAEQVPNHPAVKALPAVAKGNLLIITDPAIREALASGDPISTTDAYYAIDDLLTKQGIFH